MFNVEPEILLQKIRTPNFPPETVALVKSWRKARNAKSAATEARYLQWRGLKKRMEELEALYLHYTNDKRDAPAGGWTADDDARLDDARSDWLEAKAEFKAFSEEKDEPIASTRPRASFRSHEIPFAPSGEDWFRSVNLGDFFSYAPPPAIKAKDVPAFHDQLISEAEAIMTKLADLEAAPLPEADAIARFRAEIKSLANEGAPKIGTLFRASVRDKRRFEQVGRVYWPETRITVARHGDTNEIGVERGIALIATLFQKELMAYGEGLIRQRAKSFTLPALPLAERPKRLVELQGQLLDVHRQIEAAESAMKAAKTDFEPHPYGLHPLAVLRVAPDKSRKPVAKGPGSHVEPHYKEPAAKREMKAGFSGGGLLK